MPLWGTALLCAGAAVAGGFFVWCIVTSRRRR